VVWGNNSGVTLASATIGTGATQNVLTPVQVVNPSDSTGFLQHIVAVSAGFESTLALKNDGTRLVLGYNDWGQIGNGYVGSGSISATAVPTPVEVVGGAAGTQYLAGIKKYLCLKRLLRGINQRR